VGYKKNLAKKNLHERFSTPLHQFVESNSDSLTMSFATQKDIADLHAAKLQFKQAVSEQLTTGTQFK
jgi:hypothetical protein